MRITAAQGRYRTRTIRYSRILRLQRVHSKEAFEEARSHEFYNLARANTDLRIMDRLRSSSRRFPAFGDPSVPRVDAVLAKTGLMGVESTVITPKMRRLEAHKLAGGPKIVDSTMLRALMWLESTAKSRLETVKLAPCRHALVTRAA